MSLDFECFGFTADERSAGIRDLIYNRDTLDIYNNNSADKYTKSQQVCINLIAGIDENITIKNVILKHILLSKLKYAIEIYSTEEKLNTEDIELAKLDNGLEILLKRYLNKKCYFDLDNKLTKEIYNFCKVIYNTKINFIVYNRVSRIQHKIHELVQIKYGNGAHHELDKNDMKRLLSTARLHLEISNLKNLDYQVLIEIYKKTESEQKKEYKTLSKPKLTKEQKYVPLWKVKHLYTIIHYMPSHAKSFITYTYKKITEIPVIQPVSNYKKRIIEII